MTIAPREVSQLKTAERTLFDKEWWPGPADAGLFRALMTSTCNYIHDAGRRLNSPKYV
jgi:hypothetical protein